LLSFLTEISEWQVMNSINFGDLCGLPAKVEDNEDKRAEKNVD
jgi:hypothetical protein